MAWDQNGNWYDENQQFRDYVAGLNSSGATVGVGVADPSSGGSSGGGSSNSGGNNGQSDAQAQAIRDQTDLYRETAGWAIEQQKRALDNAYNIAKLQAKTAEQRLALDKWHYQKELELANKAHQLDREKVGADLLKFGATLHGPADFVSASNYALGVRNDPNYATFMSNLLQNNANPVFSAPGGAPEALSLASLAKMYGVTAPDQPTTVQGYPVNGSGGAPTSGQGGLVTGAGAPAASTIASPLTALQDSLRGAGGPDAAATPRQGLVSGAGHDNSNDPTATDWFGNRLARSQSLVTMGKELGLRGAHTLAPGSLENLDSNDRALLASGLEGAGYDSGQFFRQYVRSRPGQGASSVA